MSDYLWAKAGRAGAAAAVMEFLAGEDVMLDRALLPFDIRASRAHARGLARIGLLSEVAAGRLVDALDALAAAFEAGEFVLDARYEDGHSAIESWLTDRLGSLGGRIHAGRSRNDQVAVALRLYMKDRLARLSKRLTAIVGVCLERAESETGVPMPGHTHLQRAMPSSLGLWWAGHAESFLDSLDYTARVRDWLNACPLGTASGFGVNLALDRGGVAEELGFRRLVVNPMAAQNARGKVELRALDALASATGDLRRLAWDLSLFASEEFGYVRISDAHCTGSSLMPNKRNPDTVELLRAVHPKVLAARNEIEGITALPSGYHRDLQNTKAPLLRSMDAGLQALALVPELLRGLRWNETRLREAITPDLFATDAANEAVASGASFRTAYRQVGEQLDALGERSPAASLEARVSPGACGYLMLDRLHARLAEWSG